MSLNGGKSPLTDSAVKFSPLLYQPGWNASDGNAFRPISQHVMNPFQLMLSHNIARVKKKYWTERARGLNGIFEPMNTLHAHNWIRREIATRISLYEAVDEMISTSKLYEDLNYEPQK